MADRQTLPPPQGPEYTPCSCSHIEPEHRPDEGPCLLCGCAAYRPTAVIPPCPACGVKRAIVRMRRWPWRRGQWWRCYGCFTKYQADGGAS